MKVITAIYLNCRPDLRDEWLTTIDIDNDLDESMVGAFAAEQPVIGLSNTNTLL